MWAGSSECLRPECSGQPIRWGWRETLVLLVVIAALSVLRVMLAAGLADQGVFTKYPFFAQQLLRGELVGHRMGDLSSGYLAVVMVLMGPLGLEWQEIRTVQIVATSMVALLCALAAGFRWGRLAAAVTALVLLTSRGVLVNALELEPETLVLVLNGMAVAALVAFPTPWGRGVAGLALGLSAVTRPTALLALVAVAAGVALEDRSRVSRARCESRRWWLSAGFVVVSGVLVFGASRLVVPSGGVAAMNPGTVFFEGMNPRATGYQGEGPRVVKAVEATVSEPDALHVGYRVVAERALGADERSRETTNRYWLNRARAYVLLEPAAAVSLWWHKLWFSLASYEAWDLETAVVKDWQLERWPHLPFGVAVVVAAMALVLARRVPGAVPLMLFGLSSVAVMMTFYVTSRQRNAVLPAVALLAGLAVTRWLDHWRSQHRHRAVAMVLVVLLLALGLSVEGHPQAEDRQQWELVVARRQAMRAAAAAHVAGRTDVERAQIVRAAMALHLGALESLSPVLLDIAVRDRMLRSVAPADRFDCARLLMVLGRWAHADAVLAPLHAAGYHPRRGSTVVSSVAYHRARCAARLGRPVREWIALAREEAPGDAQVLALAAVAFGEADSGPLREQLDLLHDRFTVLAALARAAEDLGDEELARAWREQIAVELPELEGRSWL